MDGVVGGVGALVVVVERSADVVVVTGTSVVVSATSPHAASRRAARMRPMDDLRTIGPLMSFLDFIAPEAEM